MKKRAAVMKGLLFLPGFMVSYMILAGMLFQSTWAAGKANGENLTDLQMKETEEMIEEAKTSLTKTAQIMLCDVTEGMYDPPLMLQLTKEETAELVSMGEELDYNPGSLRMVRYYRLLMTDESGTVVDEWTVDGAHHVIDRNGLLVESGAALTDWLERLEKAHDVNYSLLSRAPGNAYFSMIPLAANGRLSENCIDPSEEGCEYDLSEKEISAFAGLGSTIRTKTERNEDIDVYYILNIYDENGAELYSFSADHDGKYYCNWYPVYGEEIEDFFHSLEEKNSL